MAATRHDLNDRLVAAVTAEDAGTVRALLEDGADADTPGPDGLPLLCAAVAGFDHQSAWALMDGGADSDSELPDGTTPLPRAVDLGSPALVEAVLGKDPRLRLADAAQERLLDLARHWYETGEAEELRRRTGAAGPADRRLVEDAAFTDVEEVSLGGLTVRAGHSAVLTSLEGAFGVLPPRAEVVARAVSYPDECHVNWSTAICTLRRSSQAWSALTVLRHHPDPLHRLFLDDALWCQNTWAAIGPWQGDGQDLEFLAAWALDESDGRVLAKVLDAYTDQEHPGQEAIGLRYADHPDPRVRSQVPYCLLLHRTAPTEAAVTTVLALSRDPDPGVRAAAARSLGARELLPAFREALLNLLQDPDHGVRACAAVSLSGSDDRTAVVADALAALMDEGDQLFRASGLWHYRSRNRPTEHDRAAG